MCDCKHCEEKEFTVFWRDGKSEVIKGTDIANACNNAGYGAGALRALDFYKGGDTRKQRVWNGATRNWDKVNE